MGGFDNFGTIKLFDLLSTKTEMYSYSQKLIKQISKSNTQKRANLFSEIFHYIYIAKFSWFFSYN